MEHWHRADEGLLLLDVESTEDDLYHRHQVTVRGHHALAGARGAGGVEQRGRIVLVDSVPDSG